MSDEFDRNTTGLGQIAVGIVTLDVPKVVEGAATVLGLETNASAVQKYVAAEFEEFVYAELRRLSGESECFTLRLGTFEQRQAKMQWVVEEFEHRLGTLEARPSDLAALLDASYKVWQSTADAKKRNLLGNALRNAFDPKLYDEGLTLRLLSILRDLDYGDVHVLKRMREQKVKIPSHPRGILSLRSEQLARDHEEGRIPLRASNLVPDSLIAYHVQRLTDHGLCCKRRLPFRLDGTQSPGDGMIEVITQTVMGGRFLALIADSETKADPQAAEPST